MTTTPISPAEVGPLELERPLEPRRAPEPERATEPQHGRRGLPTGPPALTTGSAAPAVGDSTPGNSTPGDSTPGDSAADDSGAARTPQPGSPAKAIQHGKRPPARPLGAMAVVVIAVVVGVGGLLSWGAAAAFSAQGGSWEPAPSGQAYDVPPATPRIPANASGAAGAASAMGGMAMATHTASATGAHATSPAALPPMVATAPSTDITLEVDAPPLGGMYGQDGTVHDAFSPAYFAVPAGKTAHVTVRNYDDMWHTLTSPMLGLNVWIPPGGTIPSTVTFTMNAPTTGNFWWYCAVPCDSYSMSAGGYMEGEIHVVKA